MKITSGFVKQFTEQNEGLVMKDPPSLLLAEILINDIDNMI